jgi:hypothetical protein
MFCKPTLITQFFKFVFLVQTFFPYKTTMKTLEYASSNQKPYLSHFWKIKLVTLRKKKLIFEKICSVDFIKPICPSVRESYGYDSPYYRFPVDRFPADHFLVDNFPESTVPRKHVSLSYISPNYVSLI